MPELQSEQPCHFVNKIKFTVLENSCNDISGLAHWQAINFTKCIAVEIRSATFLQTLEISHAHSIGSGSDDWKKGTEYLKAAAQQFQVAILALQLTSLRIIKVDCSGYILPDHNVGNLANLRCFFLTS